MNKIASRLILLADRLDRYGYTKIANEIDFFIKKLSMPLIHNDPNNTKLVYRIQNASGEGPYKDESINKEYAEEEQPSPHHKDYSGQDFTDQELDSLFEKKEPLLFGFESPYDVVLWFGENNLKELYGEGFKLYEMFAKKIYQSYTKRQIMFIADEKAPQRVMALDEILKTRGKETEKSFLKPKTYDALVLKKLDSLKIKFDKIMKALEIEQNDRLDEELVNIVNQAINLAKHLENPPSWVDEAMGMLGILSPSG